MEVDADEQPPPLAGETLVLDGSKDKISMTAGSSFMVTGGWKFDAVTWGLIRFRKGLRVENFGEVETER